MVRRTRSGLDSHSCHWLPVQFFLRCQWWFSLRRVQADVQMLSPLLLASLAFGSPGARRDLASIGDIEMYVTASEIRTF